MYFKIISQGRHSEEGTFNLKPEDQVDVNNEEKVRSSGEKVGATLKKPKKVNVV